MSDVGGVLESLSRDRAFTDCVTQWEHMPSVAGSYRDLPDDLADPLRSFLLKRGLDRLYTHQAEAYEAVRAGRHTIVVTPTASGKTWCYNLPVMQTILQQPEARALYLFPTKALSQDQQSELNETVNGGELGVRIVTYDGDTPTSIRAAARTTGQIIISNPDMLHSGILPNHPRWITFLKNLRFVVIDEIHTYRGVFGSHMTNVVRRLKRIASFYGANPVFICSSATIGNPRELAEGITGESLHLIDRSGAPRGEKHIILYNPPYVDRVQGIRRGVVLEARRLALEFLRRRVKTIVFSRSRTRTELIASYINKSLANTYTDNEGLRVESYRGGYLPSERREIERGLRDGTIHGVVSTNALELGIDIGGLDVSISAGLPGAISSAWQQAGRAGRRNTLSASILIASSNPLDQYMVRNPGYFFGRSPEDGFVDPDNLFILGDHLKCAAFELPFSREAPFPDGSTELLHAIEETGVVRFTGGRFHWADRSYPAESISLRTATNDNVVIVDTTRGGHTVIGEIDRASAKEELFDNAVYIHRGEQFIVTSLDIANRRCYVEQSRVNYYTDAILKRDIQVLHEDDTRTTDSCRVVLGDVLVRTQLSKFKKIRYGTHENVGYGEIYLPEEEMHTRSCMIVLDGESPGGQTLQTLSADAQPVVLGRLGSVLRTLAPVYLLCDRNDIGTAERLRDPHFDVPVVYIYDKYPGGVGLSEIFRDKLQAILSACHTLVDSCECQDGCPSCVGPRNADEDIDANPKAAVLELLSAWTGRSSVSVPEGTA